MRQSNRVRRARLQLQSLESRETPDGKVQAALGPGGVLVLSGDDYDNAIILKQTPAGMEVAGMPGTTVEGGPLFPGVTAIRANMNDGNDWIQLDTLSDLVLPGLSIIDLGDGDSILNLGTSGKIDLGGLTVLAGDGSDMVTLQAGPAPGSVVRGNLSFSMGLGKTILDPPHNETQVRVAQLDVLGPAGIKFVAADGDEALAIQGVKVTGALNANGGAGALTVHTSNSRFASVVVNTIGPAYPASNRGSVLESIDTTVAGPVTVQSKSGVSVEMTNGSTGPMTLVNGVGSDLTANFAGTPTINGNLTIRGGRLSLGPDSDSTLTVTGDVLMTGAGQVSVSAGDGLLKARNISLTSATGADYFGHDSNDGGPVPGITTTGSVTFRAPHIQYIQQAGRVSVGGRLSLIGKTDVTFSTGLGFSDDLPPAQTIVTGPTLMQGRRVSVLLQESVATFTGGVTVTGTERARVESLPWRLPGDFDFPPYGAGSKLTAGGTGLTIRGREAWYIQREGEATLAAVTIQGAEEAVIDTSPKDVGTDELDNDVYGVGAKLTVAGALKLQGGWAAYFQAEGQASFGKGMSVVGTGSAEIQASAGDAEVPGGGTLAVPAGGILVQGPFAGLRIEDAEATVMGSVTVKATLGAQFGVETYDSLDNGKLTVNGNLTVAGGPYETMFSAGGNFTKVTGDVSISGSGHHRLWVGGSTGTEIGGNFKVAAASGYPDWLSVEGPLTVEGDTSVALAGGANSVDIGSAQLKGNLTVSTGSGADYVSLYSTTVGGATSVTTGAGADRVLFLKDTTFTGAVNMDTGGGADTFEAGRPLMSFFGGEVVPAGTVTFNAAAKVLMGAGNDTLGLGVAGHLDGKVQFGPAGSLSVDGGLSKNFFDDEAGQFDASKVTVLNFEDPTP